MARVRPRRALAVPIGIRPSDTRKVSRRIAPLRAVGCSERLIASLLTLAGGKSGMLPSASSDVVDHARAGIAEVLDEADPAGVTVSAQLGGSRSPAVPLLHQLAVNFSPTPGAA